MSLWDLANADCVIAMGSNIAENHPIAFRFVVEAQRKGAKVIHIDPRFTRTGALADLHAPIRSGSDIAFLGGLIRYVIENDLWFKEFALAYTNLDHIIEDGYQDPEELDGPVLRLRRGRRCLQARYLAVQEQDLSVPRRRAPGSDPGSQGGRRL